MSDVDRPVETSAIMMTDVEGSTPLRLVRGDEHDAAEPDHGVRVRIGAQVGGVSEYDGELYGRTLHAAARVMSEAAGGQILVSADVRNAVEPGASWRSVDSGLFWLPGFPERWRLYEVARSAAPIGRPPSEAARLTPLVEGDGERASLRRAVDDDARSGMPSYASEVERMLAESPSRGGNGP